jgi:hypothetical protein
MYAVSASGRNCCDSIVVVVVVGGLAGCGGSSKPSVTATTSNANTAPQGSAGSSPSAASTTSVSDCGGAVARVTAAVASYPAVTKVPTIAPCHEVDIVTNLPSGVLGSPSATTGAAICSAAAKVAYLGDISRVPGGSPGQISLPDPSVRAGRASTARPPSASAFASRG